MKTPAVTAKPRGHSLFELAVVAAVFAVLLGVLLNRMHYYQRQAERADVGRVVGALRSALEFKAAQLRIAHREAEIAALAGQNPMEWLTQKPANYLGEYYSPAATEVAEGSWYFDRADKSLVYLLNYRNSVAENEQNTMKFKVKSDRQTAGSASRRKPAGELGSVALDQVEGPGT